MHWSFIRPISHLLQVDKLNDMRHVLKIYVVSDAHFKKEKEKSSFLFIKNDFVGNAPNNA